MPGSQFRWQPLAAIALGVLISARASAAPQLANVFPRGLQSGGTTTLTLDGAELAGGPRLLIDLPLAAVAVRDGAADNRVQLDVTLDASVPPGLYALRLANSRGISNAVLVAVDALPQAGFAPETSSLPVALHGALGGSQVVTTRFPGTAGQRLVVDVEARRLGANFNPSLRLLDPAGRQLAWAKGSAALSGDARLTAQLPADGSYTVELHDLAFQGGAPGHFRLKLGDLQYADFALPLAVQRGSAAQLQFAGTSLPAGARSEINLASATFDAPAPLPTVLNYSGPRPAVAASDFPEVVEERPADGAPPSSAAPVGVTGRLGAAGEEDLYRIAVQPGSTLRLDLLASRLGSPLDGVLTVLTEQGTVLGTSDDRPGTIDPGLDVGVPADVQAMIVAIRDLLGRGGDEFVYRLVAEPAGRPDFSLALVEDRHHVPQQGAALVRVRAERRGYNGLIALELAGLPAGMVASDSEIPAGAVEALVTLTAAESQPSQAVLRIVGSSTDPSIPLVRPAMLPESAATRRQPWLRGEVGIASVAAGPLSVVWSPSADESLPLGGALNAAVTVTRAAGVTGPVRLSLITTQTIPTKNENNQVVPDLARALRVEGPPMVAAEAANLEVPVLVPADLPVGPYDLAFAAELLSADGQQVLATAVSPARRLVPVRPSFAVEITGEARVSATAGSGPTGKLVGRVVRIAGFDGDVLLTLAGPAPESFVPALLVPTGQGDFEFPVSYPVGTPAGDLAGVKLAGSSVYDDGSPAASNNQLDVAVSIVPGGSLPALYPVFEDEAHILPLLAEGDGRVELDTMDRYSGALSLAVLPPQRFRTAAPTLKVRIKENPGEGEFRYLRFAWKKIGGTAIVLQLNAGGQWGPQAGDTSRPAYRYSAGPDAPAGMATLKVADAPPAEWTVVTRDLFADFGEFELTGMAFTPLDGDVALFDHLYLARTEADLAGCPQPVAP
jgi:hypothetical protein